LNIESAKPSKAQHLQIRSLPHQTQIPATGKPSPHFLRTTKSSFLFLKLVNQSLNKPFGYWIRYIIMFALKKYFSINEILFAYREVICHGSLEPNKKHNGDKNSFPTQPLPKIKNDFSK